MNIITRIKLYQHYYQHKNILIYKKTKYYYSYPQIIKDSEYFIIL